MRPESDGSDAAAAGAAVGSAAGVAAARGRISAAATGLAGAGTRLRLAAAGLRLARGILGARAPGAGLLGRATGSGRLLCAGLLIGEKERVGGDVQERRASGQPQSGLACVLAGEDGGVWQVLLQLIL